MFLRRIFAKMNWQGGFRLLNTYPHLEEFSTFCVIGVVTTVSDFFIYLFLARVLSLYFLAANALSFVLVATLSFFLNRRYTFRNKENHVRVQYVKFFVIASLGLLWNSLIIFVLVHFFAVYDLLAKAVAIGMVLFWNYGMNKLWSFRKISSPVSSLGQESSSPVVFKH